MNKMSPDDLMRAFLALLFSMLVVGLAARAISAPEAMVVLDKIMPILTAIIGFFFGRAQRAREN